MGWWSKEVFGGDSPLDCLARLAKVVGVEYHDDDFSEKLNQESQRSSILLYGYPITKKDLTRKNIKKLITHCENQDTTCGERAISYQVLSAILIVNGVLVEEQFKTQITTGILEDDWLSDEERKKHIDLLLEAFNAYTDTPPKGVYNFTSLIETITGKTTPLVNPKSPPNSGVSLEDYLKALVDLDNLTKRCAQEKEDIKKYGTSKVLIETISILDNFKHILFHLDNDKESNPKTIEGIQMVYKLFQDMLTNNGVESISTETSFNPNFHEAVATKNLDNVENNYILEEVQSGYILNGRLLRPAKVIVNIKGE